MPAGLSDTTSDHQLRDLLGAYGTVSHAYVVRHKYSGNQPAMVLWKWTRASNRERGHCLGGRTV